MSESTTTATVAEIILQQLGGQRFIAMTGARQFVGDTNALRFRLPGNALQRINYVSVVLQPNDTYSLTFARTSGVNHFPKACVDGVYCDQLQSVFTRITGLDTHL